MEEDIKNFTATILLVGLVLYGGSFFYKKQLAIETGSQVVVAQIEKKRQETESTLQDMRLDKLAIQQAQAQQEYLQRQTELQNALLQQQSTTQQQASAQQQMILAQQQAAALYQQQQAALQQAQHQQLLQQQAAAAAQQRTVRTSRAS